MDNIGTRLREERERLRMTQEAFATACGVQRRAQIGYESDARSPDARYLAAASKVGVDVAYVVCGAAAVQDQLNGELLEALIAQMEVLLSEKSITLTPKKKARALTMLYRAFKASGKIDPKMLEEVVDLAAHS